MATRRTTLLVLIALLASGIASTMAQKKAPAIDGYDPVAYFTEKRALRGKPEISHVFDDRRYLFTSVKNRDLFAANPERYEPQFNGLCAGNLAQGRKVKADPNNWRVVDGKLYLFGSPPGSEAIVARKVVQARSKWKEMQ